MFVLLLRARAAVLNEQYGQFPHLIELFKKGIEAKLLC
jgi:hypothetical protein